MVIKFDVTINFLRLYFCRFMNYYVSMQENEVNYKNESFEELVQIFTDITDKKFMKEFMECLFTNAEREDISNRWILVKEIDKGTTQREIAKKYNMSLCKITRGSKELNKKDSAFRTVLEKYSK